MIGLVISADGRNVLVSLAENGARIFSSDSGAARSPRLEVRFRDAESPEVKQTEGY